jgi:hypothetical protein
MVKCTISITILKLLKYCQCKQETTSNWLRNDKDWIVAPQNAYIKAPNPNVMLFEGEGFEI